MTPLELRVCAGLEDERLLYHIATLERMQKVGGGLSPGEFATLCLIYERLDDITYPTPAQRWHK